MTEEEFGREWKRRAWEEGHRPAMPAVVKPSFTPEKPSAIRRRIIQLAIAEGRKQGEVARMVNVSVSTVKNYVARHKSNMKAGRV